MVSGNAEAQALLGSGVGQQQFTLRADQQDRVGGTAQHGVEGRTLVGDHAVEAGILDHLDDQARDGGRQLQVGPVKAVLATRSVDEEDAKGTLPGQERYRQHIHNLANLKKAIDSGQCGVGGQVAQKLWLTQHGHYLLGVGEGGDQPGQVAIVGANRTIDGHQGVAVRINIAEEQQTGVAHPEDLGHGFGGQLEVLRRVELGGDRHREPIHLAQLLDPLLLVLQKACVPHRNTELAHNRT